MTNINSKLFFLVEKKKQERAKELELKNNPEVVEEEISEGVKAVRIMAEAKKEEPIEVIRDLSDEEVLARMAAEEEPSIIDKIKNSLLNRNVEATVPTVEAEAPEAGSTETVIISQSDSKITKQIDSTKTYSVELQKLNGGTVTYIINSDESQQISINWVLEEGKERLVVNGNGIRVTVPSDDYSNVVIGGNQNKISVDGTAKSYESTGSISFESYKSGSTVTRWGGSSQTTDTTHTTETTQTTDTTYETTEGYKYDATGVTKTLSLSRGNSTSTDTATINANDKLEVTLTNPFTGSNYKYLLSSNNGKSNDVKFEFLANGRLVITGSNLKILAAPKQVDDIILMGDYNDVYTGDMADTVRSGYVIDSRDGDILTKFIWGQNSVANGGTNSTTKGNNIFTGSGDDYVTMYSGTTGWDGDNPGEFNVDMGAGDNDCFLAIGDSDIYPQGPNNNKYLINANKMLQRWGSKVYSIDETSYTTKNGVKYIDYDKVLDNGFSGQLDGTDGWVIQGKSGHCVLLSLINSLSKGNSTYDISQFMDVEETTKDGEEGYQVTFTKFSDATIPNTTFVKASSLQNNTGQWVIGDRDTALLDYALTEFCKANYPNWSDTSSDVDWVWILANDHKDVMSNILFGNKNYTQFRVASTPVQNESKGYFDKKILEQIYNKYMDDENQQFAMYVSFGNGDYPGITDPYYGVYGSHAYAIKYCDFSHESDDDNYIEFVNPWDDRDVMRMSVNYFFNTYRYKANSEHSTSAWLFLLGISKNGLGLEWD